MITALEKLKANNGVHRSAFFRFAIIGSLANTSAYDQELIEQFDILYEQVNRAIQFACLSRSQYQLDKYTITDLFEIVQKAKMDHLEEIVHCNYKPTNSIRYSNFA